MKNKELKICGKLLVNGLVIEVKDRQYKIIYPKEIWQKLSVNYKNLLLDNLVFAETNFLTVMLDKEILSYDRTNYPLSEPFFYKNQLWDMLSVEMMDEVSQASYFKKFYNAEYFFKSAETCLPQAKDFKNKKFSQNKILLPFTFGKESLASLGLALELGLDPVLLYSQEPAHPFEEEYKKKALIKLGHKQKIKTYFLKHEPGLFRYGRAFNLQQATEIGWGAQTTLLILLSLPYVLYHGVGQIWFGSEFSNNEYDLAHGWKAYKSADQTREIMMLQNSLAKVMTCDQVQVKSSLEPLEEISIFYLLHHRYPELGRLQFSCSAEKPLKSGSAWCHSCYKCARMFLFARALSLEPKSIGFQEDLLLKPKMFDHYFGHEQKSGSQTELDFAFYLAYKKNVPSIYNEQFKKKKLPGLRPWVWYKENFSNLKPFYNLPSEYQTALLKIFKAELSSFKKLLP